MDHGHSPRPRQRHPSAPSSQSADGGAAAGPVIGAVPSLLQLQRLIGNQAVAASLTGGQRIYRDPAEVTAAENLRDAMEGLGTDEDEVYRVLGQYPGSLSLRVEYRTLTNRSLETDIRDDFSGEELDRALRLYFGRSGTVWDAAIRLRDAMAGLGTNEAVVLEVLRAQTSPADLQALRDAYRELTSRSLETDIRDDFSGDELSEALIAYQEGPPTPDLLDAIQLRNAMGGLGTDEDTVYAVLERRASPSALEALKAAYLKLTKRTIEADIRDDFSGSELDRALRLIGIGTFTNELPQDMFEGKVTVVRGRFDWRLEGGELKVNVNASFVPDEGVDVPLATWQGQIDTIWNQYALVEPGGQKIPITMSLTNTSGGKTIKVVQNETPGTYGGGDRANAGKWYPVMPADTAPHEYGHLLGLPDEYQRTQEDFEEITGASPIGPLNASGKTNEAIAGELNTALIGADETTRAGDASTVLTNVGLLVAGAPQQGTFAQEVMTAYDAAYDTSLKDTLAGLPQAGRWTLQSVFSFASGTVMGNPGVVAHEHPVAARHLREYVNIAQERFPTFTWTTGPR